MSDTILANVSKMFSHREPWDCSNSEANLGPSVARLTSECATEVAQAHAEWLQSPLAGACEAMRAWAKDAGAWEANEIAAWSDVECMALFVQNVSTDLRMLGSDDTSLATCVVIYQTTDWEDRPEYPTGAYYSENGEICVEYYTGC